MTSCVDKNISNPLKLVFIVQAHKVSNTLDFLIHKLKLADNVVVLIHVDKKSDINEFTQYESDNVKLIRNRLNISWGGYSQILLYVNVFEIINEMDFDYVSFISGDDFLIKEIESFKCFLNENKGKEFIGVQSVCENKIERRYKYVYPHFMFERDSSFKNRVARKIYYILTRLGLFKNKNKPPYVRFYKGSNWFTLSKRASNFIHLHVKANKYILDYFSKSYCCDEVFFHSILMNEPDFRYNVFKCEYPWIDDNTKSLRYIDWVTGPNFPKIFSREDLLNSNIPKITFFCRKIDPTLSLNELCYFFNKINEG